MEWAKDRPRLTIARARAIATIWCRQLRWPADLAGELGEVYQRFGIRDGEAFERQLRVRGVPFPSGHTQALGSFAEYADACVREIGWIWAWEHGILPPYPIGTVLEQGVIVGIDDVEPATFRVRPDGIPEEIVLPVHTTPVQRAMGGVAKDPRMVLLPFEEARLPAAEGFILA